MVGRAQLLLGQGPEGCGVGVMVGSEGRGKRRGGGKGRKGREEERRGGEIFIYLSIYCF